MKNRVLLAILVVLVAATVVWSLPLFFAKKKGCCGNTKTTATRNQANSPVNQTNASTPSNATSTQTANRAGLESAHSTSAAKPTEPAAVPVEQASATAKDAAANSDCPDPGTCDCDFSFFEGCTNDCDRCSETGERKECHRTLTQCTCDCNP